MFLNSNFTREASEELTSSWLESSRTTIGSQLWADGMRTFHLSPYSRTLEAQLHAAATARIAEETGSLSANVLASCKQGMVMVPVDIDAALDIWTDGTGVAALDAAAPSR